MKAKEERIRTIVTQDAEVDDQNSLRHFLLVSNQVEVQGIVQTSSIFHWIGVPGKKTPEQVGERDNFGLDPEARFDAPWRWPGTDWMQREIDDYEKVYPSLVKQAEGYPAPEELRKITKVGNIGYMGEMDAPTEGSELIRERILDDDPRTLYIQVWGGTNTIARALLDIQTAHEQDPDWQDLHDRIERKIVITACGEQDTTYRGYIAEEWPGIQFVKCLQMGSYAYPWRQMPKGASFESLTADFMTKEILRDHGPLIDGYATWKDGKLYEGEGPAAQFGQPEIDKLWFGPSFGLPTYEQYDFLSEGDSPTFFCLLDWGFRTLEDFSWGGISGRYVKLEEKNTKGEPLNYYDVTTEDYVSPDGTVTNTESMWRYTTDIQRDFAARAAWCVAGSYADAEHAPHLAVREGTDVEGRPGEAVALHASAFVPAALGAETGKKAQVSWRIYREAGTCREAVLLEKPDGSTGNTAENTDEVTVLVPKQAQPGETIHVIVQAKAPGHLQLVHYQQVILTVR